MTRIFERRALTSNIFVGKSGKFLGLRPSDNMPLEVSGTVVRIQDASWSIVTIKTTSGDIVRLRMA